MRLYPPAWAVGRLAVGHDKLGGYPIPAGSTVVVSQWVMHRHPTYWPDPPAFKPERFDPDTAPRRPRYAYFPFGGGPRACIGEAFAWMEGILLVAMLAQRFKIELASTAPVEPQPGITLRPKNGLPIIVRERKPQATPQQPPLIHVFA
jgi:cytochrome P450